MANQPPIVEETRDLARYVNTLRLRIQTLEARPIGGGGGGSQEVFVQDARPSATGPWVWWKTSAGVIIDCIVNTGT